MFNVVLVLILPLGGFGSIRGHSISVKPRGDLREYQWAELPNGLRVVNVQDNNSVDSGIAVAVEAGSFSDPRHALGLAHFCEHMLFLGSRKYPTGFLDFVSAHGGKRNAYTTSETTVYYLQLGRAGWMEALDRLADFFRAPLFNRTWVKKEVHAIGSEFAKNLRNPVRRAYGLMHSLANSDSPLSRFHTGSVATLLKPAAPGQPDIVGKLRRFYDQNYCAPRLRLVTLSKDPLPDQLNLVQKFFQDLPVRRGRCSPGPPSFAQPEAWPDGSMGQWVTTASTLKKPELWMIFRWPDIRKYYKSHPLKYVSYVMKHHGKGSLMASFGISGLVTNFKIWSDSTSAGTELWMRTTLTPKGREKPGAVIDLVFAFLSEMRRSGVHMPLYKSLADLDEVFWNWREQYTPYATVRDLAEKMTRLPKEQLLSGDELIAEPSAVVAQELVKMLVPENMNVIFADTKFKPGPNVRVLPDFKMKYTVDRTDMVLRDASIRWNSWLRNPDRLQVHAEMSQSLLERGFRAPLLPMQLAKPVKHIPRNISLLHAQANVGTSFLGRLYGQAPRMYPSASGGSLWFRQGSMFRTPKVSAVFLLRARERDVDPEQSARDSVSLVIWRRMFNGDLYGKTVGLVGVSHSTQVSSEALKLSMFGFRDSVERLVNAMLGLLGRGVNARQRFAGVAHRLMADYKGYTKMPIIYASHERNCLIVKGCHSKVELAQALRNLEPADVKNAVGRVLMERQVHYTSLMTGNMGHQDAVALDQVFSKTFSKANMTLKLRDADFLTPVLAPRRPVELRKSSPRQKDPNHVTIVSFLLGVPGIKERAIFTLLGQILKPLTFKKLRTEKQLGYVVEGRVNVAYNVLTVTVSVQGAAKSPDEVEPLVERLLTADMPAKLASLTEREFRSRRQSLARSLMRPPKSFSDETAHFWRTVSREGRCAAMRECLLSYVQTKLQSKQQLVEAWREAMAPRQGLGTRSKVVVKYFSPKAGRLPRRPPPEEVEARLLQAGVPDAFVQVALKEHRETQVLDRSGAKARQRIMFGDGGDIGATYFPLELSCACQDQNMLGKQLLQEGQRASRKKTKKERQTAGKKKPKKECQAARRKKLKKEKSLL